MSHLVARITSFIALLGFVLLAADLRAGTEFQDALPWSDKNQSDAPRSILDSDQVRALFRHLLILGGAGKSNVERAAFLVREPDGSYGCLLWPTLGRFRSEAYRGPIPENTLAIVHTHPDCCRQPSEQDARESVRTGLPFIILTRGNVYAIDPASGESEAIAKRQDWTRAVTAPMRKAFRCRELGSPGPAGISGVFAGN